MLNSPHLTSCTAIFWLMLAERQARTNQFDWLTSLCLALADQSRLPGSQRSQQPSGSHQSDLSLVVVRSQPGQVRSGQVMKRNILPFSVEAILAKDGGKYEKKPTVMSDEGKIININNSTG